MSTNATQRTNLIKRGSSILGANILLNKEKEKERDRERDTKKTNTSIILNNSLNNGTTNYTKVTLQSRMELGRNKLRTKENNENDKNSQNIYVKKNMTIDADNNYLSKTLNNSYNIIGNLEKEKEKEKEKGIIKVSVKLQEIPENNQDTEMEMNLIKNEEKIEFNSNIEMKNEDHLNQNQNEEKNIRNKKSQFPLNEENNINANGEIKKRGNLNNNNNIEEIKEKQENKIKVNEPISSRIIDNKCNFKNIINGITIKENNNQYQKINSKEKDSINLSSLNFENLIINKENQPKFSNEEYRRMFSRILKNDMGKSHIQHLFDEEEEIGEFLQNHKISERMRTRMVDWIIEVLTNYKCDDNSFFLACNTMDRYFKAMEDSSLQPAELHLIGVTSMFMASKFEDIYPLRLKIVHEKIAHKKLSMQEIKEKETHICEKLDFILGKPTQWEFINNFIEEIFYTKVNNFQVNDKTLRESYRKEMDSSNSNANANINANANANDDAYSLRKNKSQLTQEFSEYEIEIFKNYTPNMINLLRHVVIYLAKMNYHDYSLSTKKPSLIGASTIFVAMKICEQINKEEYVNEYFSKKLTEISRKNENDIIKTAQKILHNAQNFDTIFNGLENLKKIHFNQIIDLKNTK
jgi:hypothetical protein